MHPSTHLRAELEALKSELAAIKARLNFVAPEPEPIDPSIPPGCWKDPCGLLRDGAGRVVSNESDEEYEARRRATVKASDDARDAQWASMTKGCPEGYYRDVFSIVREISTGRAWVGVQHERSERARVDRLLGEERRGESDADYAARRARKVAPVVPPDEDDEANPTS
jgi:hypothetical protein